MRNEQDALIYKYNVLIRSFLKDCGISLSGNIALAVSGGSDSIFLATVLLSAKKPLLDLSKVRIIHINHNWRDDSKEDENLVLELGRKFSVPVDVYQVYPKDSKESPELEARNQRKEIFAKYDCVLTGHTSDDLFETVLWKTLQGKDPENGIKVQHDNEIRPLLNFTKAEMQSVLTLMKVDWKEDSTNHDGILLRSKMRQKLMKVIQEDFSDSQKVVVQKCLQRQKVSQ